MLWELIYYIGIEWYICKEEEVLMIFVYDIDS